MHPLPINRYFSPMLHKLTIKNYAIIDRLEIEFGERMNIITGETGAEIGAGSPQDQQTPRARITPDWADHRAARGCLGRTMVRAVEEPTDVRFG